VLDLTRVIAGPVGTRMLGALGAEVLRVDDPNRPELPMHAIDGVIGKASTTLDAATEEGRQVLHRLVAEADVVVTGYRPGALQRLGLEPDQVAERHPGTVVATLSAWGTTGARETTGAWETTGARETTGAWETTGARGTTRVWGRRRGFDSLVQVATGIGWATSTDGVRPGVLPCQLLDHATGYLLAAGVLTALARRARTGAVAHVSVSLTRTAQWLLDHCVNRTHPGTGEEHVDAYRTALGNGWSGISPPGQLDGRSLEWPFLPPAYGRAAAAWRQAS
jgi:crotonobetainyl-CoA:carnitine CoA-transferase CaiB-like acyl-CoA transferase